MRHFIVEWDFIRLTDQGKIWGECDHPSFDVYADQDHAVEKYLDRLREIRTANAACHHKKFRLERLARQERGQTVIGVYAQLKPVAEGLKVGMETASINPCFSLRAFIDKHWEGGQEIREVKEMVTKDWVTEGGIDVACKYKTPSLESALKRYGYNAGRGDINITPELLSKMEQRDRKKEQLAKEAGLESNILVPVTRLRNASGHWQEVPTLELRSNVSTFREW